MPIISVAPAYADEGDYLQFVFTLSEPATSQVTVQYRLQGGTARSNDFYDSGQTLTVTFDIGETTATVQFYANSDSLNETDESVMLEIFNPVGADFAGGVDTLRVTGVIHDMDGATNNQAFFVGSPVIVEGDGGTRTAVFEVRLSEPSTTDISLTYTTLNGTALAGSDYTAVSGTLTMLAGQSVAYISVPVRGDTTLESAENFFLRVTPPAQSNNGWSGAVGEATIRDDDAASGLPSISVEAFDAIEGDYMEFVFTLSEPAASQVTVQYRLQGGTAGDDDFYDLGQVFTVTFDAGETTATVRYYANSDSRNETDETVLLEVFEPIGAELAGGVTTLRATGVIHDMDGGANQAFFVGSPVIVEGDSGSRFAVFEVRLSEPSATDISLAYTTANGSAVAGSDYTAVSGTLVIRAGQSVGYVSVPVTGDAVFEASETFSLRVTPPAQSNNGWAGAGGEATIRDDDASNGLPSISVEAFDTIEGGYMQFVLTLSEPADTPITVQYRLQSATGDSNDIYDLGQTFTVTFGVGETTATVRYYANSDSRDETDESVFLDVFNPSGAMLAGGVDNLRAIGVIQDMDGGQNTVVVGANVVGREVGADGADQLVFLIKLSQPANVNVSFTYDTLAGAATPGQDYTAVSGTVTFLAGQQYAYVRVPILADTLDEGLETMQLRILPGSGYGSIFVLTGTIIDNDIHGTSAVDGLVGTDFSDNIYGFAGNDTLDGRAGNDVVHGGAGADRMQGGLGNDTYYVDNAGDVVVEAAGQGRDLVYSAVSHTLSANVEDLTLTGSANVNATGNGSDNTLTGNSGANTLNGGAGEDRMIGGAGNDYYVFDNRGDRAIEAVNGGIDTIRTTVTVSLAANIENVTLAGTGNIGAIGNALNNRIIGNEGNNVIKGGLGRDRMEGGRGNDNYLASKDDQLIELANGGTDTIRTSDSWTLGTHFENLTLLGSSNTLGGGNAKANVITGNSGNNTLFGGGGADTLRGGDGLDRFVYTAASDSTAANPDRILDLRANEVIDLRSIDANSRVAGNQAFAIVDAFTGQAGQMTVIYNAATGLSTARMDINGDGVADMAIIMNGDREDFAGWWL